MADQNRDLQTDTGPSGNGSGNGSGAATAEPPTKTSAKPTPKKPPSKRLPLWKVLLHNDDTNTFDHVIVSILELTPLNETDAVRRAEEAHRTGVALLLITHKERAELFEEQFRSKALSVTIEPAD